MKEKRCTFCGIVKPLSEFEKEARGLFGHRSDCRECRNRKNRDRRNKRPDLQEKNRARALKYSRDNPEWNRERVKVWAQENHEHVLDRAKRYWHTITDKVKYNARRRELRKESGRQADKQRRMKIRATEGSFTQQEWKAMCKKYGNKCVCCHSSSPLTADHVIPISKGGTNYISNIQPLCGRCNSSKGTKMIDYRPDKGGGD